MINLFSRLILGFLVVLFFIAVAGFVLVWSQSRREFHTYSLRLEQTEEHLTALREEREAKEAYLRAFLNDPEMVERVVRERLGYVRKGETLFRYETW